MVNYIFPSYPRRRRRRMPPPFVPRHGKHMPTNHLSHVLFIHKSNLQFTAAVCYMADVPRLSIMSTGLYPQACSTVLQDSSQANQLLYIVVSLSLDACWCFNTAMKLASRSVHVHVWCTHKQARSHLSAVLILQIFCCPEPVHQRLH